MDEVNARYVASGMSPIATASVHRAEKPECDVCGAPGASKRCGGCASMACA